MDSRTSKTSSGVLSGVGSSPFATPRSTECPRPWAPLRRRCRRNRPALWATGRVRRRSAPGRARPLPGPLRRPTRSQRAGPPADPIHGSGRPVPPESAPVAAGSATGGRPPWCRATVATSSSRRLHRARRPTTGCRPLEWRTWAAVGPPPAPGRRVAASPGLAETSLAEAGPVAAAADRDPAVVAVSTGSAAVASSALLSRCVTGCRPQYSLAIRVYWRDPSTGEDVSTPLSGSDEPGSARVLACHRAEA